MCTNIYIRPSTGYREKSSFTHRTYVCCVGIGTHTTQVVVVVAARAWCVDDLHSSSSNRCSTSFLAYTSYYRYIYIYIYIHIMYAHFSTPTRVVVFTAVADRFDLTCLLYTMTTTATPFNINSALRINNNNFIQIKIQIHFHFNQTIN